MQTVVQFLCYAGLSLAWHLSPSTAEHIKEAFGIRILLKIAKCHSGMTARWVKVKSPLIQLRVSVRRIHPITDT